MRAAELVSWMDSGEYDAVIRRKTAGRAAVVSEGRQTFCRACGYRLAGGEAFCPFCGGAMG